MSLKERAAQLSTDLPAVYLALKDKETPAGAKVLAWITVAYALSPIDLIPDFIPVLGYADDLLILPFLIRCTLHAIPPQVMDHCRKKSSRQWENGKPKSFRYAVPILLFWGVLLWLVLRCIFF